MASVYPLQNTHYYTEDRPLFPWGPESQAVLPQTYSFQNGAAVFTTAAYNPLPLPGGLDRMNTAGSAGCPAFGPRTDDDILHNATFHGSRYPPFVNTPQSSSSLLHEPMAYTSRPSVSSSISGFVTSPTTSGPFLAAKSSAQSFSGYPFFTEEQYHSPFQQPAAAWRTVASVTSQLPHGYATNFSSTFPQLPKGTRNHNISEEATLSGRSQSSNPPSRVIAPIPRRAFVPHAMLTTAAMLSSNLNQQHNSPQSSWQVVADTAAVADARAEPPWDMENQAYSPAAGLDQSAGHINSSLEEGVDPLINRFSYATGGGTSTSSGEPAMMLNTRQAEHGQRFQGSVERETGPRNNRKHKAEDALVTPSVSKRARVSPSSQIPGRPQSSLTYRPKNQIVAKPTIPGSSVNQGPILSFVMMEYSCSGSNKQMGKMKEVNGELVMMPLRKVTRIKRDCV